LSLKHIFIATLISDVFFEAAALVYMLKYSQDDCVSIVEGSIVRKSDSLTANPNPNPSPG